MLSVIDDLAQTLAELTLSVKSCFNKPEIIKEVIIQAVTKIYYDGNDRFQSVFDGTSDSTPFIIFTLNENQLKNVINSVFINNIYIKQINKALKHVKQNDVDLLTNTLQLINIDKLDLEIGEERDLDDGFFNRLHHSSQFKPVVYINGNVIVGDETDERERTHHGVLYNAYGKNEKFHKNDIIKKPMEEWKKIEWTWDECRKYHGVSAVIQTENVCTINGFDYTDEAAQAINKKLGCKVFAVSYDPKIINKIRRFAKKRK